MDGRLDWACEVLTKHRYKASAWRATVAFVEGDRRFAYKVEDSMTMLDADMAVAMAEFLERQEALGSATPKCPTCEDAGSLIVNAGVLSRGPISIEECPDCREPKPR